MMRKPNSSGLSVGINNSCLTSAIKGIARIPATAPAAAVRNLRRLMKDIGVLSPFLIQISFQGIRLPFILLRAPSASVRRVQLKWEYIHAAVNSSEAVVNLIRVNSWPVKPTTNFHEFHENDHFNLDTLVIDLRKLLTGAGARGSY